LGRYFLNENKEKRFETGWRIYVSQHERTLVLNLGRSKDGARGKSGNSERERTRIMGNVENFSMEKSFLMEFFFVFLRCYLFSKRQ
jgi:hypothetical protein